MNVAHQAKNCSGCPSFPDELCPECDEHNRIYHNVPAIMADGTKNWGIYADCWESFLVIKGIE